MNQISEYTILKEHNNRIAEAERKAAIRRTEEGYTPKYQPSFQYIAVVIIVTIIITVGLIIL